MTYPLHGGCDASPSSPKRPDPPARLSRYQRTATSTHRLHLTPGLSNSHLVKVYRWCTRQVDIPSRTRALFIFLPSRNSQMMFRPINIILCPLGVQIGKVAKRSRVNSISAWVAPCIELILILDDIGAFRAILFSLWLGGRAERDRNILLRPF